MVQNYSFLRHGYNPAVACKEHYRLEKVWQEKERESARLSMVCYGRSIKRTLSERETANVLRISAETTFMEHVKNCHVCQSEGKKAWKVDTHPPNF